MATRVRRRRARRLSRTEMSERCSMRPRMVFKSRIASQPSRAGMARARMRRTTSSLCASSTAIKAPTMKSRRSGRPAQVTMPVSSPSERRAMRSAMCISSQWRTKAASSAAARVAGPSAQPGSQARAGSRMSSSIVMKRMRDGGCSSVRGGEASLGRRATEAGDAGWLPPRFRRGRNDGPAASSSRGAQRRGDGASGVISLPRRPPCS